MASLEIKKQNENNALIIVLEGEIDKSTSGAFRDTVTPWMENEPVAKVIYDFSGLKFINSEGIGLIMSFHTKLLKREKKDIFVGLQKNVKDVFDLIGLTTLIPTYPDLKSALP